MSSFELTDGVRWIPETIEIEKDTGGADEHIISLYLLRSGSKYVLIDSGSYYHRDSLRNEINAHLDGELEAVALSHADLPHSGNLPHFLEEWGDTDLIFTAFNPGQQGFGGANIRNAYVGRVMEIAGRELSFIDPPLVDRPHTVWIFDHDSETLFTADGFGSFHSGDLQNPNDADIDDKLSPESVYRYNKDTFQWLRYGITSEIREALDAVIDEYDPAYVAPIHGYPLNRDQVQTYLSSFEDAVDRIYNEYTVPTAAD